MKNTTLAAYGKITQFPKFADGILRRSGLMPSTIGECVAIISKMTGDSQPDREAALEELDVFLAEIEAADRIEVTLDDAERRGIWEKATQSFVHILLFVMPEMPFEMLNRFELEASGFALDFNRLDTPTLTAKANRLQQRFWMGR